jgi:hypothetical protein
MKNPKEGWIMPEWNDLSGSQERSSPYRAGALPAFSSFVLATSRRQNLYLAGRTPAIAIGITRPHLFQVSLIYRLWKIDLAVRGGCYRRSAVCILTERGDWNRNELRHQRV